MARFAEVNCYFPKQSKYHNNSQSTQILFCVLTEGGFTFNGRVSYSVWQGGTAEMASARTCFCRFLTWLTFQLSRWRYVLPKRQALSELHGVTTQKPAVLT
jgi:hypothetical protein